jgi:orotidine-5'-phosphate decarboxylase
MVADRLFERIASCGPVCFGLDTAASYLPPGLIDQAGGEAVGILAFNQALIDATHDIVACYKVQIAYYEALGLKGMAAYAGTVAYARALGVPVIGDVKRGDIAATGSQYAKAHFSGDFEADWITVNPYMGSDAIEPFLDVAIQADKGIFVLVRTSNPGAADFEYLTVDDARREPLYMRVAAKVAAMADRCRGSSGYSAVGAVTGCTQRSEVQAVRQVLSGCFLLIPGYGAQGGTAEDVAAYLVGGNGGVVNASRSLLLAWKSAPDGAANFAQASRQATLKMRDDIAAAVAAQTYGEQR